MSLINGLTSILKGSGNQPIDDINVYVTNTTAIPVEDENLKKFLESQTPGSTSDPASQLNVRMKPTPADFTSMKSLMEIVPNGFLLIHNDIQELLESSGKGSTKSSLLSGGVGGLVAGATSGIVSGLFDGFFGDKTKSHLNNIADELNQDLTVDDFRGDAEVEQAQKDAFIQYLRVYYLEQTASMAGKAVGTFASEAITETVKGIFKGIFDLIVPGESSTKLGDIATELDKELTVESITSDDQAMQEVKKVQKDSVIMYLKTYYAAQISEMAGQTVGNFFGGAVKEALSGVIEGTVGAFLTLIGKNEKEADPLQKIADELTAQIKVEDFVDDPEVLKTQKDSVISYLKLYYEAQINEMSGEAKTSEFGAEVETLLSSVIDGTVGAFLKLFGANQKPASKLNDIADKITDAIVIEDYTSDQEILNIQKDAIAQYIKLYYEAQISEMEGTATSEDLKNRISGSIKGFVGGIFDGLASLIGKENEEETTKPVFATKVQDIITIIDSNLDVNKTSEDEAVINAQKEAVLKYISVYYQTQIDQLNDAENQTWYGSLFGNIGSALNNFWSNLTGSSTEAESQFMVAVGEIAEISQEQITTFSNDSSILDVKKAAIKSVVERLLQIEGEAIVDHYKAKSDKEKVRESLEGFADSYLNSISTAIKATDSSNSFSIGSSSMGASSDISVIRGNVATMNVKIQNIYNVLKDILDNMGPSIVAVPSTEDSDEDLIGG